MAVKHAAVIGAGTIGASWAAYFLSRGLSVVASDPAPTGEAFIRDYVRTAWPALERLGLAPGASAERLRFERDPAAAVVGAEFVQESAPEREDMKVELFERLDRALPPEVILASSSSGILISNIAARCRHPRTLGSSTGSPIRAPCPYVTWSSATPVTARSPARWRPAARRWHAPLSAT